MNSKNQYPVLTAAAKAGMCPKTARKYLKLGKLPSECKKARTHRTRSDPFAEHWQEIEELLQQAPELQAKTAHRNGTQEKRKLHPVTKLFCHVCHHSEDYLSYPKISGITQNSSYFVFFLSLYTS